MHALSQEFRTLEHNGTQTFVWESTKNDPLHRSKPPCNMRALFILDHRENSQFKTKRETLISNVKVPLESTNAFSTRTRRMDNCQGFVVNRMN